MGKRDTPFKVRLTNAGKDTEMPWAEDLGPATGRPKGSRLVQLVNVPFHHAKPTWGDVIAVEPARDGVLVWDRKGVEFAKIGTRIEKDGGRWMLIVDYDPHPDSPDADRTYSILARACAEEEVVCEGARGPAKGEPGRAYLAVQGKLSDVELMKRLRAKDLPCELIQIHPVPAKKKAPVKKPVAKTSRAAKPATKRSSSKKR